MKMLKGKLRLFYAVLLKNITKIPDVFIRKSNIIIFNPERRLNKRLLQQLALGAITFLRSFFFAGKANFCSQLLASLVHFIVVKSQAILIIRLGVTELFPP